MEKYRLVKGDITNDPSSEATAEHEIRITQQGKPRNYISRAMDLLVSVVCGCALKVSLDTH